MSLSIASLILLSLLSFVGGQLLLKSALGSDERQTCPSRGGP